MMENGRAQQQRLERHHRGQRHGEENDDDAPRPGAKQDLAEMEAHRRAGIERAVEVMHGMEAPQQRKLVVGAMPPVNKEVERSKVQDERPGTFPPVRPDEERMAGRPGRDRHHDQRR